MSEPVPCPCGSGLDYGRCCRPLHHGEPASSPEALMRSRYSAFVRDNADYMRASWHPDTRPAELTLEGGDQWLGLEIVDAKQEGDAGQVHFRATHRDGDGFAVLEEHSRFVRENDHWFYLDGEHTVTPLKPGRNNPCPCGSGRKFKKCCG
ncbi:MAG TPA: hypothetical protein DEQ58_10220 [Alcanivorax sp.]|nr:zinc chelation protein SecC [Alcanivorax sp.]MBF48362.1 zinc chelation protein SecC [Alcanivorax sp.]MBT76514.1 zinc chelation protein SecC [Alcanivorax sp.]HAI35024.1 hypothetical protein [Alcanivorax sp.]HAI89755.1 hypothetical protein [Alcanivorax sp.]